MPYIPPSQSPLGEVATQPIKLSRPVCQSDRVFGSAISVTQKSLWSTRYSKPLACTVKGVSTLNRQINEIQELRTLKAVTSQHEKLHGPSADTRTIKQKQRRHGCQTVIDGAKFNQTLTWEIQPKTPSNRSSQCIKNTCEPETKSLILEEGLAEILLPVLQDSSAKREPRKKTIAEPRSKIVRFDSHLEHVRFFFQVDKPVAVSTDALLAETHSNEAEILWGHDGLSNDQNSLPRWKIILPNFPIETPQRTSFPIRLEQVFLPPGSKELVGSIAVSNLAFSKVVIVRYTLDEWATFQDLAAEFSTEFHEANYSDGYDHFKFNIKLAGQANLETKLLWFCVKYCVNGEEYWDNNSSANFQVKFRKKAETLKANTDRQRALPRSSSCLFKNDKKSPSSILGRLESESAADNCHATNRDKSLQVVEDYLSTRKTSTGRVESLARLVPSASGQPFGNRYNFDVALSAAIRSSRSAASHGCGPWGSKPFSYTKSASLSQSTNPWNTSKAGVIS